HRGLGRDHRALRGHRRPRRLRAGRGGDPPQRSGGPGAADRAGTVLAGADDLGHRGADQLVLPPLSAERDLHRAPTADDRSSTPHAREPSRPLSWPMTTRRPGELMTYPPQNGAQQPQYGTGYPGYGTAALQYTGYQPEPPRKKRGLKRIIFGILGILANGVGLFVMPFVAGVLVAVVALLGATPATIGGASGTVDASATALTLVYVPTSEAASTTCTVEGSGDVVWDGEQS